MKIHAYTKHLYNRLILLILFIVCLGQISSCSNSNNTESQLGVVLAFLLNEPLFFAWKDGDGVWVEELVSGGSKTLNVQDKDGRYTFAAYGMYRGINIGYYVETTVDDAQEHNLMFDNTDAMVTNNINVSASNFNFGSFWVGKNFRNFANQTFFLGIGSGDFTTSFMQDADAPDVGDVVIVLNQASIGHSKEELWIYSDSSTFSYTADPADANTLVEFDQSAVISDSDYQGMSVKFSGINLKALFLKDFGIGSPMVQFEKFPVASDKIFTVSARWEISGSPFFTDIKYSQYFNDPPAITVDKKPAIAPDVTVGSDNNNTVRFDFSAKYDGGLGLTNVLRGATVGEWRIKQTVGRYQIGAQYFGFDAALLDLSGFPAGMEPTPLGISKVSFYETNRTIQKELNFLYSGHKPEADNDNMIRLRVSLNF